MNLIDWDDSFSVGVAEIDDQHKHLVKLLNDLHNAMGAGKSSVVMGKIIQELIDYTKYHFGTEEKYFEQTDYPDKDKHKEEHDNFVKTVLDFQQKYNAGQAVLGVEVKQFLKDWLIGHIKGSDKAYTQHFNANGIK